MQRFGFIQRPNYAMPISIQRNPRSTLSWSKLFLETFHRLFAERPIVYSSAAINIRKNCICWFCIIASIAIPRQLQYKKLDEKSTINNTLWLVIFRSLFSIQLHNDLIHHVFFDSSRIFLFMTYYYIHCIWFWWLCDDFPGISPFFLALDHFQAPYVIFGPSPIWLWLMMATRLAVGFWTGLKESRLSTRHTSSYLIPSFFQRMQIGRPSPSV